MHFVEDEVAVFLEDELVAPVGGPDGGTGFEGVVGFEAVGFSVVVEVHDCGYG